MTEVAYSLRLLGRFRRIGFLLLIYPLALWISSAATAAELPCLASLTDFMKTHELTLNAKQVNVGPRWVAAGHEVRKLPGHTVRMPVAACGATVAIDLAVDCRILKSRGEGNCRSMFPLTFH